MARSAAGLSGCLLLWWTWLRVLRQGDGRDAAPSDLGLAGFLATACTVSLLGLGLSLAGWFSFGACLGAILLVSAMLLARCGNVHASCQDGQVDGASPSRSKGEAWVGAAALVLGAVLYLHPGEPIAGNWDPGVYLAQGAALAREGSYLFRDTASPLLEGSEKDTLYPFDRGVRVKYPGFYLAEGRSDILEPQFFPLFPMWIAGLAASGSLRPALWLTGLLSLLSLVMVVKLGQRLGGWVCAAVAGLLFLLNPVQAWFAGFPTAEVLMQFFFLAGLWCWVLWLDEGLPAAAWIAGTCFALTMFTSVTGLFLAGLVAAAFAVQLRQGRGAPGLVVPCVALLPLVAMQNLFFTTSYFEGVARYLPALLALFTRPWILVPALLGLLVLGVGLVPLGPGRKRRLLRLGRIGALAAFLAGMAAFLYLLAAGDPEQSKLRILSAMVSRIHLVAAVVGVALLAWKRPRVGWTILLVVGAFTYLFLSSRMMVRLYPWAYKRYLPVTLPLVCLCAGYAWSKAAEWGRHPLVRVLVLALVLVLAGRLLYRGRSFAFHRDWAGLLGFTDRLAEALPPEGVVFADKWIATPLEFVHGRRVLPLQLPPEADSLPPDVVKIVRRLVAGGHPSYIVFQPAHHSVAPLEGRTVFSETLWTSVLDQSPLAFGARPRTRTIHLEALQVTGGPHQAALPPASTGTRLP